ncbi:hypothetical protein [Micromonospora sp. NPDC048169]|uniref:hypothetical protein n=1 Tax=Micromonospora sp. NPDC048169 TaxID=3154711 RepID=UPI0033E5EAB6
MSTGTGNVRRWFCPPSTPAVKSTLMPKPPPISSSARFTRPAPMARWNDAVGRPTVSVTVPASRSPPSSYVKCVPTPPAQQNVRTR